MTIEMWLAFVVASLMLQVIPGPTVLAIISYSISHGSKARVPLIAGVALGDSTALALSLLGLGAVLSESAFWFQVIRWAGGLYLIYQGIKLFREGIGPASVSDSGNEISVWKMSFNAWLITALNPKGILFFVAFLPQFINPEASTGVQLWMLAITFVCLATFVATLYALFAGKARELLSSGRARKVFSIPGGTLLSTAGVLALSVRQA